MPSGCTGGSGRRAQVPGGRQRHGAGREPPAPGAGARAPHAASPLNPSCGCLNSEISFTLSLALLTCVAFGVIREKILCPFTITGFWNIKMSLCIGSVILIGILTFD